VTTLVGRTAEKADPSGECRAAVEAPPHRGRWLVLCIVTASGKNSSSSTAAAVGQRFVPTVRTARSVCVERGSRSTNGLSCRATVRAVGVHATRLSVMRTVSRSSHRIFSLRNEGIAPLL
jgi:hypothetical protein